MVSWYTEVPGPGVAALIGFATQVKLAGLVSYGSTALHTLPFGVNSGDTTGTQGIGV